MPGLQTAFAEGLAANRPAASSANAGYFYYATDSGILAQSTGSAWVAVGFSNPMTTQDDLIVGGTAGAPARLGKGTDGQVLTVDPTTHHLVWATPSAGGMSDPTTTKGDLIVHGTSTTRLGVGTDTQVLTADSTQTLGVKWAAAGSGLFTAYLCYQDQQTQNTAGASITSGSWATVRLTTEVADTGNNGSVSSNQLTLAAGTYKVLASVPFWVTNRAQARLRDVTNSVTLLTGSGAYSNSTNAGISSSFITGLFTLAGSTVVEVQAQVQTTGNLGVAANFGTEVYAQIELFKE